MKNKKALITGITGQDGSYLGRIFNRKRVRSTWFKKKNKFN